MADLKTCLKGMGAENISTILASGNVWLDWEGTEPELHEKCEAALSEHFRYPAKVILRSKSDLSKIVHGYPWPSPGADFHRYVLLCGAEDSALELAASVAKLATPDDQVAALNRELFWMVPRGITLESQVGKLLSAAAARETTTMRNLNTIEKMLAKA